MADEERSDPLHELVRGRVSAEDEARLKAAMATDPQLAAEQRLVAALNETDAADASFPGEFGWARLSREIDRDRKPALWRRQMPVWQVAACLLVGVVAWQFTLAPQLTTGGEPARFQTATGGNSVVDATATVRVVFAPTATAEAMAALLRDTGASIVDGPSAIGFYTLSFDTDEARAAALPRFGDTPSVIELIERP